MTCGRQLGSDSLKACHLVIAMFAHAPAFDSCVNFAEQNEHLVILLTPSLFFSRNLQTFGVIVGKGLWHQNHLGKYLLNALLWQKHFYQNLISALKLTSVIQGHQQSYQPVCQVIISWQSMMQGPMWNDFPHLR